MILKKNEICINDDEVFPFKVKSKLKICTFGLAFRSFHSTFTRARSCCVIYQTDLVLRTCLVTSKAITLCTRKEISIPNEYLLRCKYNIRSINLIAYNLKTISCMEE